MSNLYDFLRRCLADATASPPFSVNVTPEDIQWLKQYLSSPDVELHFKAVATGEHYEGEPVYKQDYAIAGKPVDIFCLITEAMLQNGNFAELVIKSAQYFLDHVPGCHECMKAVEQARRQEGNWIFSPHKPIG